jgi:hypothetical protein
MSARRSHPSAFSSPTGDPDVGQDLVEQLAERQAARLSEFVEG